MSECPFMPLCALVDPPFPWCELVDPPLSWLTQLVLQWQVATTLYVIVSWMGLMSAFIIFPSSFTGRNIKSAMKSRRNIQESKNNTGN
jgi:hypothetical protein